MAGHGTRGPANGYFVADQPALSVARVWPRRKHGLPNRIPALGGRIRPLSRSGDSDPRLRGDAGSVLATLVGPRRPPLARRNYLAHAPARDGGASEADLRVQRRAFGLLRQHDSLEADGSLRCSSTGSLCAP